MNDGNVLEFVKIIGNFVVIPLCAVLWNIQSRLARIEGKLSVHLTKECDP